MKVFIISFLLSLIFISPSWAGMVIGTGSAAPPPTTIYILPGFGIVDMTGTAINILPGFGILDETTS